MAKYFKKIRNSCIIFAIIFGVLSIYYIIQLRLSWLMSYSSAPFSLFLINAYHLIGLTLLFISGAVYCQIKVKK